MPPVHTPLSALNANNGEVEDPLKIQAAAEVSVDVLFAAFEKFLAGVWKEKMGPVMAAQTLTDIQHQCCKLTFLHGLNHGGQC